VEACCLVVQHEHSGVAESPRTGDLVLQFFGDRGLPQGRLKSIFAEDLNDFVARYEGKKCASCGAALTRDDWYKSRLGVLGTDTGGAKILEVARPSFLSIPETSEPICSACYGAKLRIGSGLLASRDQLGPPEQSVPRRSQSPPGSSTRRPPRYSVLHLSCRFSTLRDDTLRGPPPQFRFSGSFCNFDFSKNANSPWGADARIVRPVKLCRRRMRSEAVALRRLSLVADLAQEIVSPSNIRFALYTFG